MSVEIGRIEAIYRYPIKSMRGERLETAALGWHGLAGDRRLALRRLGEVGGNFPWLSASRLPALVCFTPLRRDDAGDAAGNAAGDEAPPTHVRTPEGEDLPALGETLAAEVTRRLGAPVEMMQLRSGIFDEATISVITPATLGEVCRLAGVPPDVRRFRPNVVVRTARDAPFEEDEWLGGTLVFGEAPDAPGTPGALGPPAVAVTQPDVRCSMLNIDPDVGTTQPEVLRTVVRLRENLVGMYGTVTRTGRLAVGQAVYLRR